MKEYQVYYLVSAEGIEAGPFPTVDAAVHGKSKFIPPFQSLLSIVKSTIQTESL
jgi:hypothetical protein